MKIIVDGQLIEYSDSGSGRVVLLLHGWSVDSGNLAIVASHLSKKFRVISFDFPGFGGSPMPETNWSVDDYAKITSKVIEKLKIGDLYAVLGHSFGGRVIIKGIAGDYFSPKKIILMGAAGVKPKTNVKKIAYKTTAKIGKVALSLPLVNKFGDKIKKHFYERIGSVDYINAGKMKQIFLNVINEDLLPLVPKIKQPSLLIWGVNDTETPIDEARKILANLPNGKLVELKDAGHFVHIDQSQRVLKELDEFLL